MRNAEFRVFQALGENCGVLVADPETNEFALRFRRDWSDFAGDEAEVLELIAADFPEKFQEMGVPAFLAWIDEHLSNTIRCGDPLNVMAIDLERMRRADRVFDLGRIAGELQHFYMQATGNKYAADPFIRHFLWEYSCHFPDRSRAFQSITGRIPFQMGLTLLRIARNSWVHAPHRQRLIAEAKIILRTS